MKSYIYSIILLTTLCFSNEIKSAAYIQTNKTSYLSSEDIIVNFYNGPGNPKDWIGLYQQGAPDSPSIVWQYVNGTRTATTGLKTGVLTFPGGLSKSGTYNARFFADEGHERICGDVTFNVTQTESDRVKEQALPYYDKAALLEKNEKYDEALINYKKAVQIFPEHGEANRGIGVILYRNKKYHEALTYLNKASEYLKDDPWIHVHIARCFYDTKEIAKALDNYDKSIAVFEKRNEKVPAWVYMNTAMYCYTDLNPKDPDRAIKYSQKLIDGEYDQNAKTSGFESMAFAYYEKKDLINALAYAKLRGRDWWMTQQLSPRKIVFNCTLNFNDLMKTRFGYLRPGLIKMHMPMDTDYQNFISLESNPKHIDIIKDGRENLAVFDFSRGFPDKLTLKITLKNITVNNEPNELFPISEKTIEEWKFADRTYFKSFAGMEFDTGNPVLIRKVNEITRNDRTHKQKVLSLVTWIKNNITHDMNIPKYANNPTNFKKISEVMQARHGYCTQISALFIGMCRMIDIPARMIQGWHLTPDHKITRGPISLHDTVEIYDVQNRRWVYVEPQGYSGLGINYWAHVVFYSQKLEPRDNFVDIMMITGPRMTYEVLP